MTEKYGSSEQYPRFDDAAEEHESVWEETGSHASFNIDELTDESVIALYNQGLGGPEVARRAKRLADVAALDASLGFPEGAPPLKTTQEKIAAKKAAIERVEASISQLQAEIAEKRAYLQNHETARLVAKLHERQAKLKQLNDELSVLESQ